MTLGNGYHCTWKEKEYHKTKNNKAQKYQLKLETIKPGKNINGETIEAREKTQKTQKHGGDGADEIMRKLRKERRAYLQRGKRRRRRGGSLAARRRCDFRFRYLYPGWRRQWNTIA
ncbi:hypothetical protein GLYMA_19G095000v4 [Glycine max]|uniref:Uncharacterized protein n=2 Tax=Glycine subgen. Soja TaxID=1462606 RepID=A0A0R0EJU6_SOYBN|nr:hypothetical protein GLYMA_19G095000v4 [Glycine max]RZB47180.1 hypothetical protein D0Y65_050992 [Glycine soja]